MIIQSKIFTREFNSYNREWLGVRNGRRLLNLEVVANNVSLKGKILIIIL